MLIKTAIEYQLKVLGLPKEEYASFHGVTLRHLHKTVNRDSAHIWKIRHCLTLRVMPLISKDNRSPWDSYTPTGGIILLGNIQERISKMNSLLTDYSFSNSITLAGILWCFDYKDPIDGLEKMYGIFKSQK